MHDLAYTSTIPSFEISEAATEHETLIADHRDGQRPSEFVQNKFMTSLPDSPIPVSCMHTHRRVSR